MISASYSSVPLPRSSDGGKRALSLRGLDASRRRSAVSETLELG
jgi:hypothetical protein